jgi:molybdate transport system ATP-binding protein
MDEPLTGLDMRLKDRILTYLERLLVEFRLPTLFVSHDQTDVRRLAEHVVVLDVGRVVDSGPAQATIDRTVMNTLGPVNLVRVQNVRLVDGHWEGDLGSQRFAFSAEHGADSESKQAAAAEGETPAEESPKSARLVQFRPSDVTLTLAPVEKTSARNRLAGEVREVVMLAERAFAAIDVGQPIWAEVMHDTVRELQLATGVKVTCLIKASAATALA